MDPTLPIPALIPCLCVLVLLGLAAACVVVPWWQERRARKDNDAEP